MPKSKKKHSKGSSNERDADYIPFERERDYDYGTKRRHRSSPKGHTHRHNGPSMTRGGPHGNSSRKRKRGHADSSDSESEDGTIEAYPWLREKNYFQYESFAKRLHQEILDFVEYISPTPEEHFVRRLVVERVRRVVSKVWPEAKILCFGSYDTKLYLPTSDIDLVVYDTPAKEPRKLLRVLARAIESSGVSNHVQQIPFARVPILKFKEKYTKFNVDISFNLFSGVDGARIVKKFLQDMPALRPLVLVVKHYLALRGLNEVFLGGIGSYSVLCMIMNFLQLHPLVQSHQILPEQNLGVMLLEFLELYGRHFNYDKVALRLTHGGSYLRKPWRDTDERKTLLSIQDPQDATNDVAKSSYHILQVRQVLASAYDILTAAIFRVYGPTQDTSLMSQAARETGSILGAVWHIPASIVQMRTDIYEVWSTGKLQRAIGLRSEEEEAWAVQEVNPPEMVEAIIGTANHGRLEKAAEAAPKNTHVHYVVDSSDEERDDLMVNIVGEDGADAGGIKESAEVLAWEGGGRVDPAEITSAVGKSEVETSKEKRVSKEDKRAYWQSKVDLNAIFQFSDEDEPHA
ncbi:uncharacterized protein VTP21DRAFT_9474 [Calcarisporiella thermophila]|uniref:uncharacterized protein n=1 Tax=Calcarisporiella thermophila TaxID=911321 RepID=UPI003744931C